ncbi:DUF294 nucleotidyltransferase-like domain-containing protein [Aliagarivorans marinus]|uniref:DUF294 nucleotidyltransferase-like domain-containing protein n=1 Tax=Aliagarivorans marinus TaxID=561965 RepID=UPI00041312B5|nr:DUF294 nucleotidyltransferase-like domain-containing protein [Aliagarivorans marinus]
MQAEQIEIAGFLSQYPPFEQLPQERIDALAQMVEVAYYREGDEILRFGDPIHDLFVVRSGVVEVYRRNGDLYNRLTEGGLFGQMGLLVKNQVRFPVRAVEDSLVYCIPEESFEQLYNEFEEFADFVAIEDSDRMRNAVVEQANPNDMTTSKVKNLIQSEAVVANRDISIRAAAQMMDEHAVSYLLIEDPELQLEEDSDDGRVIGIVTDSDLRSKVLAAGLDYETEVGEVMTTGLSALDHNAYVYEAMLMMLRNNLQHLPIVKRQRPLGVVSLADILHYESQSSLLLVQSIYRAQNREELALLLPQVKDCFVRMVNEDANSHMIGSAMSVIGRSFKQRLLELAEEQFGEPPIPYCFVALGSMARDEQLIVTDQDNALILDDSYQAELHQGYFEQLAGFVCEGLNECGYVLCSGGIMATNPKWRMTLSEWEERFGEWIDNPDPKALLNSSIFFDLDGVWGRVDWAEQLKSFVARRARRNNRFLASLARNALSRTPPLGFFKDFVMEKDGRHNNSINLKRRGSAPLSDVIRVHALAVGSRAQNSFERLDEIIEAGILPKGRGQDLRDSLEFILMVRIRHQAMDIEQGIDADNNIEPENMSEFERRHLKDAFQILSNAQNFLKFRYHSNRAGLS